MEVTTSGNAENRMQKIFGHHHMWMMRTAAALNCHLYTQDLSLRLATTTVSQTGPTRYHLCYGDRTGSPGTALTFFEMPNLGSTYPGTNAIQRIGLIVPNKASLLFWQERFAEFKLEHSDIEVYRERAAIHFKDPDGLPLV